MNSGDVIFWKGFSFEDGEKADKLLVIIGSLPDQSRLLLKTTSQTRSYRPDADGCHSDASVHRFKQYLAGFRIPTWIQFDPPIIRNIHDIKIAGVHTVFSLKPTDIQAIINCYKKSPDISDALLKYLK